MPRFILAAFAAQLHPQSRDRFAARVLAERNERHPEAILSHWDGVPRTQG